MHVRPTTHYCRSPPIDAPPYTVPQSCTCYARAHPKCHARRRSNRSPVYVSSARTQEGFRTLHYVLHAGIDLIDAHQASRVTRTSRSCITSSYRHAQTCGSIPRSCARCPLFLCLARYIVANARIRGALWRRQSKGFT